LRGKKPSLDKIFLLKSKKNSCKLYLKDTRAKKTKKIHTTHREKEDISFDLKLIVTYGIVESSKILIFGGSLYERLPSNPSLSTTTCSAL
jgi:hypothetical protein